MSIYICEFLDVALYIYFKRYIFIYFEAIKVHSDFFLSNCPYFLTCTVMKRLRIVLLSITNRNYSNLNYKRKVISIKSINITKSGW